MQPRIVLSPTRFRHVLEPMLGVHAAVRNSGLSHSLLELIKVRVSQINGCGYCLDMHTRDARAAGETEQRLYLLSAWREAPMFSDQERAALAWVEAVTRLEHQEVPDEVFAQARKFFSEEELASLTLAVVEINGWNRIAISFRLVPGSYQAAQRVKEAS